MLGYIPLMQPGSPYPPQEPPAGQPLFPGQPDPAREWQQGYPQPVFQAAPLPGTGFENPPNVTYPSEFGGCEIEYLRSNEYVSADFEALPGVHDLASCAQVGLPYVQKLYALVG